METLGLIACLLVISGMFYAIHSRVWTDWNEDDNAE